MSAPRARGSSGGEASEAEARALSLELLEAAPDAMVVVDLDGRIVFANTRADELFRTAPGGLEGTVLEELVPHEARDRHVEHRRSFARAPRTRRMSADTQLNALRSDGLEFPVEISLSPLRTPSGMLVTAAIRDVTDRRKMIEVLETYSRELERSNRDLDQFASVASHDLREPLRSITWRLQLLVEDFGKELEEEAHEYIDGAVNAAKRLNSLIEGLLAFARLGSRGHPHQQVELDQVLDSALEHLGASIEQSRAHVEREPLPAVHGDPVQLTQLFQNLVGNALKFCGDEPPWIRITASAAGPHWIIDVEDHGIGIPPRHREQAFVIFRRLHPAGRYSGTGIGLAVCKRIAEGHGGRIWVEPVEPRGSLFRLELPRWGD